MKKKVASLFFIAFCLAFQYGAVAQTGNAMRMLEMQQYNKAKAAFLINLKTSNSANNWFFLGKVYSIQNNIDSARICFNNIAPADPKSNLSPVGMAILENMAGNKAEALLSLDKIQKSAVSAKDIVSLIEIAEARFSAGDTVKCFDILTSASGFDKKNPRPFISAGKMYSKLGENYLQVSFNGLASGRFEQALYCDPENSEAKTNLANILVRARNYSDAEIILNEVLAKDTVYIPALKLLGELEYNNLGKFVIASEVYGKYMRLAEYSPKDQDLYIYILYFNKEYAKTNSLISKVLKNDPSNPVMLRLKGYTSFELKNYSEGLTAMNSFFALRSGKDTSKISATDYEYYGKLLCESGSDSIGIIYLKKSIELDSTKTGLYETIALAYDKLKMNLVAVDYYEKFVASGNPGVSLMTYFNIGRDMYFMANAVKGTADSIQKPSYLVRADSAFSKVVANKPSSQLGYLWRARVLYEMDPLTEQGLAKDDYQKTLEILEQKNDNQRYKNDLLEAYLYMGYYYFLKYDAAKNAKDEAAKIQAKTDSLLYWQKVIELDPTNEKAKQALSALK